VACVAGRRIHEALSLGMIIRKFGNYVGIISCEPAVLLYNVFGELINNVCRLSRNVLPFLENLLSARSDVEIDGQPESCEVTKSGVNSFTIPAAMLGLRVNLMSYPCCAAGRSARSFLGRPIRPSGNSLDTQSVHLIVEKDSLTETPRIPTSIGEPETPGMPPFKRIDIVRQSCAPRFPVT
jgi:hypothetical protein